MRILQSSLIRAFTLTLLSVFLISTASAGTFQFDPANGNTRSQARDMKRKVRASMFLHRATFGPTVEEIDALALQMKQVGTRLACENWIDAQMALPPTLQRDVVDSLLQHQGYVGDESFVLTRFKHFAWWDTAIQGPDQLRQRMAWALSQILVTNESQFGDVNLGNGRPDAEKLPRYFGVAQYYDMLVSQAFGNYRDLLHDVTYSPIMGVYLSHIRNRKSNGTRFPDENYAREIMQLFTIGLYELEVNGRFKQTAQGELIPTYDNETIKSFARIFTGLTYQPNYNNNWNTFWSGNDLTLPMVMYQNEHDTDPKLLVNGVTVDEPGSDGDAEIDKALDNLMAHDNVAPFISYRLIQRLVKSNPSAGYIRRVANKFNDNGSGVKGDLGAVVKAILLDSEAWRSVRIRQYRNPDRLIVSGRGTEYARLREPVIRYAHMIRAASPSTDDSSGKFLVRPVDWVWTQEPYQSPSVFNFWLADYQPPGDLIGYEPSRRIVNGSLVAPEFQMKTAVTSNYLSQKYIWDLFGEEFSTGYDLNWGTTGKLFLNYTAEHALFPESADAATLDAATAELVDKLDLIHCMGTMPQEFKDKIVEVVNAETNWMINNTTYRPDLARYRVTLTTISLLTSPFAAISE